MSPYKIARKILPNSIQAWLGNRHKVKRKTLDPLLFNFTNHPAEEHLLYEKAPTLNVPISALEGNPFIEPAVAATYRWWYEKTLLQQVVRVQGGVCIEPKTGWPMGGSNQLYLSLHPAGISPYMPVPAYKTIFRKTPQIALDKVISLRDVNEAGYSHFYTDLMAKLEVIRGAGCNLKEYTLVISKAVAETPYGRFLMENSPLFSELGGIFLQGDEFIACKEAIFTSVFVHPTITHNAIFKRVAEQAKAAHPISDAVGNRKVFLTRGKHRRRTMRNNEEIVEIVRAKGFEIVDADCLSLPQQIELFTHCRYLVGIHGAGLANMLYRHPHTLSLFEICEPIRPILGLNPLYHNMAVAFGFDYGAVMGEANHNENQSFHMPPEKFETAFHAFWAAKG